MQAIFKIEGVNIFYTGTTGFLLGVFLYSFFDFGLYVPAVLLATAATSLLYAWVRRSRRALACTLLFAALALGCVRMLLVPDVQAPFTLFDGTRVSALGEVVRDIDRRERSAHVVVDVEEINGKRVEGRLQATVDRSSEVGYGDRVTVSGILQLPKPFETETGKEFDYPEYLRAKGIGAVMTYPTVVREPTEGITFLGTLYFLKHTLENSIKRTLPEPAAGLLEGILLGNRAALGESLYALFIIAGLVHIVVLSGYNLTIVAEALMRLASRLPTKTALLIGASGIILFALMVGAEATVVRASIMALIVIAARALRRKNELMRALALACTLMVLHNPLILTADPSFILSFLAAFGLMTFAPALERYLHFVPERFGLRGILSATLATQVFLLPALIFYTGKLSLVALPANLLALPLIPPAMFFGFITGLVGLIHPYLALPFMIPAWGLLSLVVGIAKGAASIPSAALSTAGLQTPLIFLLYIVLVPLALWAFRERQTL